MLFFFVLFALCFWPSFGFFVVVEVFVVRVSALISPHIPMSDALLYYDCTTVASFNGSHGHAAMFSTMPWCKPLLLISRGAHTTTTTTITTNTTITTSKKSTPSWRIANTAEISPNPNFFNFQFSIFKQKAPPPQKKKCTSLLIKQAHPLWNQVKCEKILES